MSSAQAPEKFVPGGFKLKFHWRILGTPAPMFPGFEADISERVPDGDKPDAVWHRERARDDLDFAKRLARQDYFRDYHPDMPEMGEVRIGRHELKIIF